MTAIGVSIFIKGQQILFFFSAHPVNTKVLPQIKIIDTGKASREDLKKLHDIFCRGTHFTDSYYIGKGEDELINAALSNDKTGKNVSGELLKSAEATYASNKDIKRLEMSFDLSENNGEILLKAKLQW